MMGFRRQFQLDNLPPSYCTYEILLLLACYILVSHTMGPTDLHPSLEPHLESSAHI